MSLKEVTKAQSLFKREKEEENLKKQEETTILGSFSENRSRKWNRSRKQT